jgi:hypothetical protein
MAAGDPVPDRPHVPDYGIPQDRQGLLSWDHAAERLKASRHYWVVTAGADATPHAVPVWGVWLRRALFLGGGPDTRWARNLAANPNAVAHLESGEDVVLVEGPVGQTTDADDTLVSHVQDAYEAKYNFRHPPPFWILKPRRAFAWTSFPKDATRWRFPN